MVSKRTVKPPKGLSLLARRWWDRLIDEYAIRDAGGLLLLETALRAFDRAEQAREVLDRDGVTTTDARGRPKQTPRAPWNVTPGPACSRRSRC